MLERTLIRSFGFLILFLGFSAVLAAENKSYLHSNVDLVKTPPEWVLIADSHQIRTFKASIPGEDTLLFRGITEFSAPPAAITSVAFSPKYRKMWVDRIDSGRVVARESDVKWLELSVFNPPWPFKQREFVVQAMIEYLEAEKKLIISGKSVESELAPVAPDRVRGVIYYCGFAIRKTATGCEVEVMAATDTKGNIPLWVVNLIQKSWPRNTLEGIRRIYESEKSNLEIDPKFTAFFN